MANGHALFYSVSDAALYEKLKSTLPEKIPDRTFAFPGDTFGDFEHWLPGQKGGMMPTARLLWKWSLMEHHTLKHVAPALHDVCNDVVIVLGFGRDVYHYAVRHEDCPQTLEFHKVLVKARIVQQGINPPLYILTRPDNPRARRIDDEYFADPMQRRVYLCDLGTDYQANRITWFLGQMLASYERKAG